MSLPHTYEEAFVILHEHGYALRIDERGRYVVRPNGADYDSVTVDNLPALLEFAGAISRVIAPHVAALVRSILHLAGASHNDAERPFSALAERPQRIVRGAAVAWEPPDVKLTLRDGEVCVVRIEPITPATSEVGAYLAHVLRAWAGTPQPPERLDARIRRRVYNAELEPGMMRTAMRLMLRGQRADEQEEAWLVVVELAPSGATTDTSEGHA